MARFPVMPLFTDAMVGDTMHLTAEEFGAYALILIATWRNNGQALPDDDKRLAHTARVSTRRWRTRLRPVLAEFFDTTDGFWHQKRLEAEWARAEASSKKQSARATKGWTAPTLPFAKNEHFSAQKNERFSAQNCERFSSDNALNSPKPPDAAVYAAAMPAPGNAAAMPTITREASLPKQDYPSCSNSESVAAREVEKSNEGNPVERAARALAVNRPRPKTPALRAQIKAQLAWKHCRFLSARGRPGEAADYFSRIDAKTCLPPPELFEAVDARMRAARWDDMRAWKAQNGIRA